MKIGYFVETPVEHNLTGGSRSFLDLIEELIPMGVEPYVVVHEPWALTEELRKRDVPYITTKMYRPFVGVDEKVSFYRTRYFIKNIINHRSRRIAVKFFRDNGVQLIHVNSQFCGIIGAQVANDLRLPYIFHIREFLSSHFGIEFYNKKQANKLIGSANAIIAISTSIEQFMKSKYPMANIKRIYNGLNFDRVGCPDKKRLVREPIKMVIVGRVTEAKNQWEAVEATKILVKKYHENIILYIVGYMGKDEYELKLKRYVEEENLTNNVIFVPFSNNPMKITHECDIGLTCSVMEAFGRVTIENMMSNLFVIGSNSGGTPELINDGQDGLLYELGDAVGLAEKISWVIHHADQANRMLMSGKRKAIEEFSIQTTAKRVLNLYNSIVEERK